MRELVKLSIFILFSLNSNPKGIKLYFGQLLTFICQQTNPNMKEFYFYLDWYNQPVYKQIIYICIFQLMTSLVEDKSLFLNAQSIEENIQRKQNLFLLTYYAHYTRQVGGGGRGTRGRIANTYSGASKLTCITE